MKPHYTRMLDFLADGHTQRHIARREGVIPSTVANRFKRIREHIGASTTEQLMFAYGKAQGLEEAALINDKTIILHPVSSEEEETNEGTQWVSAKIRQAAAEILDPPQKR